MGYIWGMSSTTNDPQGEYGKPSVKDCPGHSDPDRSGLCIHCGGITDPDADDWNGSPDRCIGEPTLDTITITTKAEAEELLSTYTLEEVRQLWENGAFASPIPSEVKSYFVQRFIEGDL